MSKEKEFLLIIIALIIFEFIVFFPLEQNPSPLLLLTPVMILGVSIITKKIASGYFNIRIEHKIWEFERYGWPEKSKLKKPFPIGVLLPFLISFLSLGIIRIFTLLQFDGENVLKKRLLRKRGIERRHGMNEGDLAFTAFFGFLSLMILAILGSLSILQFIPSLAKYSIYYALWNLIPISNLDGAKLLFGARVTYYVTLIAFLIAFVLLFI